MISKNNKRRILMNKIIIGAKPFNEQKILVNTEKIKNIEPIKSPKTFVLFLPDNEIHDIGLLFINYELTSRGYKTIFLGQSVPIENLMDLQKFYDEIIFISYFTVQPDINRVEEYLSNFYKIILQDKNSHLYLLGRIMHDFQADSLPDKTQTFNSIENLVKEL